MVKRVYFTSGTRRQYVPTISDGGLCLVFFCVGNQVFLLFSNMLIKYRGSSTQSQHRGTKVRLVIPEE